MIDAAKAQGVERSDGPGAHGKNISQNTADAGGGSLIGFNKRRMVMTFHFESHGEPVADIDDAGVFTGSLEDMSPFRRQLFKIRPRTLVAAVLRPHNRENAQLGIVRLAPKNSGDLLVFLRSQTMARHELRSDHRLAQRARF